ncbi:MAG TPA: hypothetical protein VK806_06455 [Bacteroidia bacterium]|jgi:outer membrane protein W|nr:hypothetical protein [Bacteroidia bacterium]
MKKLFLVAVTTLAAFTLKAGDHDDVITGLNVNNNTSNSLNFTSSSSGGTTKKLTFSISAGIAMPLGAFGNKGNDTNSSDQKDTTHYNHGYAITGFHADLTISYLITDKIGVTALAGLNALSFDAATYKTVNGVPSTETLTATNYSTWQFLVGPYLELPASDKLKVDIRLLGGMVTNTFPTITQSGSTTVPFFGTQTYSSVYSRKSGSGFGYSISAGARYNLTDAIGISLNVAYTGSSIAYTGYTQVTNYNSNSSTYNDTTLKTTLSLSILTATVGVCYSL